MYSTPRTTAALESLSKILSDPSYFRPHGGKQLSAHLRGQLEDAQQEIGAQLAPIDAKRLRQMVERLMLHFGSANADHGLLMSDYLHALGQYPEDLLSAAYGHVLRNHKYHTLPKIADLVMFIEPEFRRRKAVRMRVEMLVARMPADAECEA